MTMDKNRQIEYINAICQWITKKIEKGEDPVEEFEEDIQNYIRLFPEVLKKDKKIEDNLPF